MSQEQIAQRIAAKCYFAELAASRALGMQGIECYTSAFRAMDETYLRAFAPDRAPTLTRFRPMGTK